MRFVSLETREKLRQASLGKHHTAETKLKLSRIVHQNFLDNPAKWTELHRKAAISRTGLKRGPISESRKQKIRATYLREHSPEERQANSRKGIQAFLAKNNGRPPNFGVPLSEMRKTQLRVLANAQFADPLRRQYNKERTALRWLDPTFKERFLASRPRGSSHPNWRGGGSWLNYPAQFSESLKEDIRMRDGHKCQNCGVLQTDHNVFTGVTRHKLDVHHINYNKFDCRFGNLIALCRACNVRANYGDRTRWSTKFYLLLANRDIFLEPERDTCAA